MPAYSDKKYTIPNLVRCYLRYIPLVIIMLASAVFCLFKIPSVDRTYYQTDFDLISSGDTLKESVSNQIEGIIISEESLQLYAEFLSCDELPLTSRDLRNLTCDADKTDSGTVFHISYYLNNQEGNLKIRQDLSSCITENLETHFPEYNFVCEKLSSGVVVTPERRIINYILFVLFGFLAALLPVVFDLKRSAGAEIRDNVHLGYSSECQTGIMSKVRYFFCNESFSDIYLYAFSIFYPVLPQYFTVKNIYFGRFLILIAFLSLIFSDQIRKFEFTKEKICIAFAALITFIVPMIANRELLTTAAVHYISVRYLVILYYIVMLDDEKKRNTVLDIFLISGLVITILSFTQITGYNIFSLIDNYEGDTLAYVMKGSSGLAHRWKLWRLSSTFSNAISYGIYLTFLVSICFYKLLSVRNKIFGKRNILYIAMILLFDMAIILTVAKAVIFWACLLHLFYIFFLDKKTKKIFLCMMAFAAILFFILVCTKNYFVIKLWNSFINFVFHRSSLKSDTSSTFYYRLTLFERVKNLIDGNWLFGLGRCYTPYTYYYNGDEYMIMWSYDNFYLDTLLKQGVWGLSCAVTQYMAVIILFARQSLKKNALAYFALCTVIIYMLNLISLEGLYEGRLFFPLIGLYLSVFNEKNNNGYCAEAADSGREITAD